MSKPRKPSRDAARPENKLNAFDDVVTLLKERKKYVDWIAALEAKKEQTPEHVYTRVHGDYEVRLKEVAEKLASHRGSLAQEQATLTKKLDDLEEQILQRQDERAEIEIRGQVGELSASALTEALRVADTELDRLTAKHTALEADLTRVNEFFAAAEGSGAIPQRSSKPTPTPPGGFDELSFLKSVVGEKEKAKAEEPPPARPVEVPAKPVEVPAPTPPAPPPAPAPAPTPPPEPTPTPAPTPAPAPPQAAAPEAPAAPAAPRTTVEKRGVEMPPADAGVEKDVDLETPSPPKPVPRQSIAIQMASMTLEPGMGAKAQSDLGIIKTGDEMPPSILEDLQPGAGGGGKPLAANVASNNPLSLKASGAPSDLKTLKCRECDTMNDPSEWYCEKCGAELSAI